MNSRELLANVVRVQPTLNHLSEEQAWTAAREVIAFLAAEAESEGSDHAQGGAIADYAMARGIAQWLRDYLKQPKRS